ncbi:NAD+ synthase [Natrialbaceae archaeon GCM10025810]|uniref:NAD+ synthase n=1 Tax=Halovalidus salilacus TaxID=3075124 RepID=UPI00360EF37C
MNDEFLAGRALEAAREGIVSAIRGAVAEANAEGVVVAMSGGIDSTVTAALAVEALEGEHVLGLGLPSHKTDATDVSDARTIAEGLGIEFRDVHLHPLVSTFEETVTPDVDDAVGDGERPHQRNLALGNLTARFRMATAYYAANRRDRIVLGTANRTELLLGYFTKHGDGGADQYPIGDLYKTEVRALAGELGVPRRIVTKDPTAGFWAGQTDEGDLGAPYEVIDPLLRRVVDEGRSLEEAADPLPIDREAARAILELCLESAHKRRLPPTAGVTDRPLEDASAALDLEARSES